MGEKSSTLELVHKVTCKKARLFKLEIDKKTVKTSFANTIVMHTMSNWSANDKSAIVQIANLRPRQSLLERKQSLGIPVTVAAPKRESSVATSEPRQTAGKRA